MLSLGAAPAYGPKVTELLSRIKDAGIPAKFLRSMMPDWVNSTAERVPGAIDELKVSLARRLGLDLASLLDRNVVEFAIPGHVRYKGAKKIDEAGSTSPYVAYCSAVARSVSAAISGPSSKPDRSGGAERALILADKSVKWVSLNALLRRCWEYFGVAVIQIENGPDATRGFDAATFRVGDRYLIVVAKAVPYPAWASFIVAHELGHIAGGHLGAGEVILDDDPGDERSAPQADQEEHFADQYALHLLGEPNLLAVKAEGPPSAAGLAKAALEAGSSRRIDPGHLILRFARETGKWQLGQAALRSMHTDKVDVGHVINAAAARFIQLDDLGDDARALTENALGFAG
jgi:hypothetical protein